MIYRFLATAEAAEVSDLVVRCFEEFVAPDYAPDFEVEGNLFLHENRLGEAKGIIAAIEAGAPARYLYPLYDLARAERLIGSACHSED